MDQLISLGRPRRQRASGQRVALLRAPFFSPMSPPLGIGTLKAYLERHGHPTRCYDLNVDPDLWDTQRKYFETLKSSDEQGIHDGFSRLWALINAHMHAHHSGRGEAACERVVGLVAPSLGLQIKPGAFARLHALVSSFFARLAALVDAMDFSATDFVGTSTYTTSLAPSLFVLRRLKQRYPHVKTVIGGGVFADDLALGSDNLATLERECDYVDHAILGEGELLLLRLVEGDLAHKRVISIADLRAEKLDIADVPPPDFADFDIEAYFHLSIEGGRSCPFECSFCSETIQWGGYRKKSAESLASQMLALAEGTKLPRYFMGDSLVNPYVNGLSKELIDRGADLLYDGYLRADKSVGRREAVASWAKSGFYRARLGLESAATNMLQVMDKKTTPQTMLNSLRLLCEEGIRTTTYWVVGHPGETESDFEETLAFVKEAHPYIYELEAHPYYYHPYGQVASRLYESKSVYPEEVTEVIRFRAWDLVDPVPRRDERFSRLQRMSKLAADLGIPNIYSMAERYEAEGRWSELSPKMREVY